MKIIVTRPNHEAVVWVEQLRHLGFDAVALPLIEITSSIEEKSLMKIWSGLGQYRAVMFVSSNAVRSFFLNSISNINTPNAKDLYGYNAIKKIAKIEAYPRMWATGLGTLEALLAQCVPVNLVDAPATDAPQFDSEALWCSVQAQIKPGDKVLIVRGSSMTAQANPEAAVNTTMMYGRPWLADQLTAAGAHVDTVVSYQRSVPKFDDGALAVMTTAATDSSVWLLSSSEAVTNLRLASDANWSQARAIATHPRIAQAAKDAGFGVVYQTRPTLEDIAASLESVL
jgi:uroporphyrinogen-III synthase